MPKQEKTNASINELIRKRKEENSAFLKLLNEMEKNGKSKKPSGDDKAAGDKRTCL